MIKNKRKDFAKLNLIISLLGTVLILIPIILISLLDSVEPDTIFLIGTILVTCSIPMIIVVSTLFIGVIVSSIIGLTTEGGKIMNIIALTVSILSLTICIVGAYQYYVTGSELLDVILRMG